MSNETTPAIKRGSSALSRHPLFGCTCCTYPEGYEKDHPDSCPVVDGDVEHDYSDECWKNASWSTILAADVLKEALHIEEISDALATARHYGVRLKPDQANYLARVIRTTLLGATS